MPTFFHIMPVDKTTIKTQLRIHPALFESPKSFIRKHGLQVRSTKLTRGNSTHGPTQNLTLNVLNYKGIKLELRKISSDPQTTATIHFNPGVCLYGHNGSPPTLTQFLDALCLLVTHLKPLLKDSDDWVDLIPGLTSGGVAYWSYLEIAHQVMDPDGTIFSGFRHAHRPKIRVIRQWPTSIEFGGKKSNLRLSIYKKAIEMEAHDKLSKAELSDRKNILRLEAKMKEEKLVEYFGNERNVEVIGGKERLVWFHPQTLITGHRKCFGALKGVYHSTEVLQEASSNAQLAPLGRLLALATLDPRTTRTFPELLAQLRFYSGGDSDTITKIREAGLMELSRRSSTSQDVLLSDTAYGAQFLIASRKQEANVCHKLGDIFDHRLINAVYRPPDQSFQPTIQLPEYLRL